MILNTNLGNNRGNGGANGAGMMDYGKEGDYGDED
jgi:hypothetical protein